MATKKVPFQDAGKTAWLHIGVTDPFSIDWAHYITKGAVKMHTLLDHDSLSPEFVNTTMLILTWLKHIARYKWALANLVVTLRLNTSKIDLQK